MLRSASHRRSGVEDLGGRVIRGYELHEQIDRGGYGVVYRAHQLLVDRDVAVKIILPQYANHPDFIRRFEFEAQTVARLEHLHIVPLYDYWREPDGAYLVMRYLRGGNLREALGEGPLGVDRTLRIADQVALALASAHRQGVIHRDVKPPNILFDEEGNAYLSDFGIARDLAGADARRALSPAAPYVSPEAARGEPLTAQADVFGLGAVVRECLSREVPGPSPDVEEVLARATATEPSARYADV